MVGVFPADKIFWLQDTHGLPFEATFELLMKQKYVCNLKELLAICVNHGWNKERTEQRIRDAWADVYPTEKEAFLRWADG